MINELIDFVSELRLLVRELRMLRRESASPSPQDNTGAVQGSDVDIEKALAEGEQLAKSFEEVAELYRT